MIYSYLIKHLKFVSSESVLHEKFKVMMSKIHFGVQIQKLIAAKCIIYTW